MAATATWTCDKCGMGVGGMTCAKCGKELQHGVLKKDDGNHVLRPGYGLLDLSLALVLAGALNISTPAGLGLSENLAYQAVGPHLIRLGGLMPAHDPEGSLRAFVVGVVVGLAAGVGAGYAVGRKNGAGWGIVAGTLTGAAAAVVIIPVAYYLGGG